MLSRLCSTQMVSLAPSSTAGLKTSICLVSFRKIATSLVHSSRTAFKGSKFTENLSSNARDITGQSIRERLLGPTTGKPLIYGTYAVAGASVIGVGMLCFYGLGMSKELSAIDRSGVWPEYVRERLRHTYQYLAGGLALTAASGVACARSPFVLSLAARGTAMAMIGSIALMIGTGELTRAISYENSLIKHLAWGVHCGVMGAVLAPLCIFGGPVILRAAWYTAGIVAGLSATAICAPSEKFLNMAGPLAMGLGLVFVSSIGTFFFTPGTALGAGLHSIVLYGGLILFSAFILYETQRIIKLAEIVPESRIRLNKFAGDNKVKSAVQYDPINAQMSIYLNVLNIFIRLAIMLGSGNQRNK